MIIIERIKQAIADWWSRNVCCEFDGPEECFVCDRTDCDGCPVMERDTYDLR